MVKLVSPDEHSSFIDGRGDEFRPDASGQFDLPPHAVGAALSAGFTYAAASPASDAAAIAPAPSPAPSQSQSKS